MDTLIEILKLLGITLLAVPFLLMGLGMLVAHVTEIKQLRPMTMKMGFWCACLMLMPAYFIALPSYAVVVAINDFIQAVFA